MKVVLFFYLDASGCHGLVAALINKRSSVWGCEGISIPNTSAGILPDYNTYPVLIIAAHN
jgi:hypothetical protein